MFASEFSSNQKAEIVDGSEAYSSTVPPPPPPTILKSFAESNPPPKTYSTNPRKMKNSHITASTTTSTKE